MSADPEMFAVVQTFYVDRSHLPELTEGLDQAIERFTRSPEFGGLVCLERDGVRQQVTSRQTVGLLGRRQVVAGTIVIIGKESNRLDERASGELTIDDVDVRLTRYEDGDDWRRNMLPILRELGAATVADEIGISERRARDILKGRALPHRARRIALVGLIAELNGGDPRPP